MGRKSTMPKLSASNTSLSLVNNTATVELDNDNDTTKLRVLLNESKVDVNYQDKILVMTSLILATTRGHFESIKLLLETGQCDVNLTDLKKNSCTVLIKAASRGHSDIAKLLLEIGQCDVNLTDNEGLTALMWAALNGNEACAKLLIEMGNADMNVRDKYGTSALLIAKAQGHTNVVNLLSNHMEKLQKKRKAIELASTLRRSKRLAEKKQKIKE